MAKIRRENICHCDTNCFDSDEDYEDDDCEIPPLLDDIDIHALLVESVEEKTEILEDPPAAAAAAAPLFPHTVGETTFRPEDIFKHPAYKYIKAHIDYKKNRSPLI